MGSRGKALLATIVVAAASSSVVAVGHANQDDFPPPGFQVDLRPRGVHVECHIFRRSLNCLIYGRAPVETGRSCDFGGTIATVTLRRRGRAQVDNTCVDEGYHGWDFLARGSTFRHGRFRCRNRGRSLSCSRGASRFTIGRRGRIRR